MIEHGAALGHAAGLATRPKRLHYFERRTAPRGLDRDLKTAAVSIGRLRGDTQYHYKFVCCARPPAVRRAALVSWRSFCARKGTSTDGIRALGKDRRGQTSGGVSRKGHIQGSGVAIVTPFDPRTRSITTSWARLIEYQLIIPPRFSGMHDRRASTLSTASTSASSIAP